MLVRPDSRGSGPLALNPRACGDAGWQLSFAAVAGILALGRPLRNGLRRLCRAALPSLGERIPSAVGDGLVEGIAITLAATLATAPLLAHHFGSVPSTGLLANLLALPAVAPAMWLGMVKAALGQAAAPAPPVGWLASALGPLADLPVAYLAALAERLGGPRSGQLSPPLGGTLAVTGAYGALAIAAAAALRAAAALGPRAEELAAAWRRRPRSHRFGVGAAALVAMVLGGVRLLGTPPPPDVLTVRFLDVGQGGRHARPTPGWGRRAVRRWAARGRRGPAVARSRRAPPLRRGGHPRLTRPSRRAAEVLERYPVGVLLDGGDGTRDPGFRALIAVARRRACAAYRPSPR